MAQQTAIDWLVNNLEKHYVKIDIKNTTAFIHAKQMEKEQIINADLNATRRTGRGFNADVSVTRVKELGEQYYNETYGKQ
jgi:hypothetical protein